MVENAVIGRGNYELHSQYKFMAHYRNKLVYYEFARALLSDISESNSECTFCYSWSRCITLSFFLPHLTWIMSQV